MENKAILYFDSAATTPTCEDAAQKLRFFSEAEYGNPSSAHSLGERSAAAIRDARRFFAKQFGVQAHQVIFTGSGSEADNLAVQGVAFNYWLKHKKEIFAGKLAPRVLCLASEHPAILSTVRSLADFNFDIQFIPVDASGVADAAALEKLLTPETILVSIMRVNNIMGAIQPIEDLARLVKKKVPDCIFHSDCIQAFGRIDLPVAPSAVDLISLSAHKIEGPKGVGALIALNEELVAPQSPRRLRPQICGGSQEQGLRSGTQSAALIAAFHVAAEQSVQRQEDYWKHCQSLRKKLMQSLESRHMMAEVVCNSPESDCVPHIVSLSIPGYAPAPLAKLLEEDGILISTGSACSSKKSDPEAALQAMGLKTEILESALRISFSRHLDEKDVDCLVKALDRALNRMCQLMGKERRA